MGGLAKGLEVLRAFSRDKPHMTLSEVRARACRQPLRAAVSTLSRNWAM